MKFQDMLRNMKQLQATTRALLISNILLVMGLCYGLWHITTERDRIVLVPPHLDHKAVVAWNAADKEYLKAFGLYMATLVGNIQPKSSSVILEAVSAFMEPSIYTDFRRQLLAIIEDPVFRASGAVISFLPGSIQYEVETNRVFVLGTLITASGTQKYQKNVVYEIGARIRDGRPWVTHFLSYEGTIPRTVNWHVMQAQKSGKDVPDYALPLKYRKVKDLDTEVGPADLSGMVEAAKPGIASSDALASEPSLSAEPTSTPIEQAEIVEMKEPS